jgi:hypothetical protein
VCKYAGILNLPIKESQVIAVDWKTEAKHVVYKQLQEQSAELYKVSPHCGTTYLPVMMDSSERER